MRKAVSLIIIISLFSLSSVFAGDLGTVSSKFNVKLYGFIKFETIYDNTQVAQGDWLLYAKADGTPESEQSVFTMNARHTRLGMEIAGPEFGNGGKVNGLIEIDFAGGFPNSSTAARQPNPRLRHAWVELAFKRCSMRFGQDWALISGPFPNTTSFVVGAGKGNLWMRYPQFKYTRKMDAFKFAVSVNRPMAGNVKYEDYSGGDFDPVGDGEKSGLPWIMARTWFDLGGADFSISGHYGQEQIGDLIDTVAVVNDISESHDMTTYSINADATVKIGKAKVTVKGFMGENLNSFFGGVFQGFTRDATSVSNVASLGGWGQIVYEFNEKWSGTLGGGMDDPDDDDLTGDARTKNTWIFANGVYSPVPPVTFMFEAESLTTGYADSEAGSNLRFMFVSLFKF